jgi:chorismate mutase
MTLEELRDQIDALDRQLVELLSERARAAQRIGHLKAATSLPVYEPGREKVIYANVRAANKGPLAGHRTDAYLRAHHRRDAGLAAGRVGIGEERPGTPIGPPRRGLGRRGTQPPGTGAWRFATRDREQAMIVAMQEKATEEQIDAVIDAMVEAGVNVHRTTGKPNHSGRRGPHRERGPAEV